jgi:hypothetical protein
MCRLLRSGTGTPGHEHKETSAASQQSMHRALGKLDSPALPVDAVPPPNATRGTDDRIVGDQMAPDYRVTSLSGETGWPGVQT